MKNFSVFLMSVVLGSVFINPSVFINKGLFSNMEAYAADLSDSEVSESSELMWTRHCTMNNDDDDDAISVSSLISDDSISANSKISLADCLPQYLSGDISGDITGNTKDLPSSLSHDKGHGQHTRADPVRKLMDDKEFLDGKSACIKLRTKLEQVKNKNHQAGLQISSLKGKAEKIINKNKELFQKLEQVAKSIKKKETKIKELDHKKELIHPQKNFKIEHLKILKRETEKTAELLKEKSEELLKLSLIGENAKQSLILACESASVIADKIADIKKNLAGFNSIPVLNGSFNLESLLSSGNMGTIIDQNLNMLKSALELARQKAAGLEKDLSTLQELTFELKKTEHLNSKELEQFNLKVKELEAFSISKKSEVERLIGQLSEYKTKIEILLRESETIQQHFSSLKQGLLSKINAITCNKYDMSLVDHLLSLKHSGALIESHFSLSTDILVDLDLAAQTFGLVKQRILHNQGAAATCCKQVEKLKAEICLTGDTLQEICTTVNKIREDIIQKTKINEEISQKYNQALASIGQKQIELQKIGTQATEMQTAIANLTNQKTECQTIIKYIKTLKSLESDQNTEICKQERLKQEIKEHADLMEKLKSEVCLIQKTHNDYCFKLAQTEEEIKLADHIFSQCEQTLDGLNKSLQKKENIFKALEKVILGNKQSVQKIYSNIKGAKSELAKGEAIQKELYLEIKHLIRTKKMEHDCEKNNSSPSTSPCPPNSGHQGTGVITGTESVDVLALIKKQFKKISDLEKHLLKVQHEGEQRSNCKPSDGEHINARLLEILRHIKSKKSTKVKGKSTRQHILCNSSDESSSSADEACPHNLQVRPTKTKFHYGCHKHHHIKHHTPTCMEEDISEDEKHHKSPGVLNVDDLQRNIREVAKRLSRQQKIIASLRAAY